MQAIRQHVTVQESGIIEIHVPELKTGTRAEVIILEEDINYKNSGLSKLISKGQGAFTTPAEADKFLRNERDSWD